MFCWLAATASLLCILFFFISGVVLGLDARFLAKFATLSGILGGASFFYEISPVVPILRLDPLAEFLFYP